jgi:mannose/fructose-specific phosphotransferase system component IIA
MNDAAVQGIVVAHSDLARALIEAVQRITGVEDGVLVPLSNEGLGTVGIRDRLVELLGDEPAVVFTDLREGSCGMAARAVCLGSPSRAIVSGVNLPMLLDFAMKRHLPLEVLTGRLVERGRSAIGAQPEPTG